MRKYVLSTNIAETSVTISGIKYVVDSGYVKTRLIQPATGVEMLKVSPVSLHSTITCLTLHSSPLLSSIPSPTSPHFSLLSYLSPPFPSPLLYAISHFFSPTLLSSINRHSSLFLSPLFYFISHFSSLLFYSPLLY